jgi:ABC-2 type transport system ATP-binding protein
VLLSTHLLNLADDLCDEVLLLDKGQSVMQGNLAYLKSSFNEKLYQIEIEAERGELLKYKEVKNIERINGEFEVEFEDDASPESFLSQVSQRFKVQKFVKIKPSLYQIFIHSIENHDS